MMKLLMTPEEAAETLSISRSKLYELMSAGEVESMRIGGSRRIPFDALEDFVDRHREGSGSAGERPLQPEDEGATVVHFPREKKR